MKNKTFKILLSTTTLLLAGISGATVSAAKVYYEANPGEVNYSDVGPQGGDVHVVYSYAGGGVPPYTSFTLDFSLSPFMSLVSGNEYSWETPPRINPQQIAIVSPLSIGQNLPATNKVALASVINGIDVGVDFLAWINAQVAAGNVAPVVQFTLTIGELPPDFSSGTILDFTIGYNFHFNGSKTLVTAGYFNRFVDQDGNPLSEKDIALGFGDSVTMQIITFDSVGSGAPNHFAWQGGVTAAVETIPEPGSGLFVVAGLALGALTQKRWRLFKRL